MGSETQARRYIISEYMAVAGPIQFDVESKEVSGKQVREVTIKSFTSQALVKITVWDGFAHVKLAKGDIIFADGKGSQNTVNKDDGTSVTYNNLSASKIAVITAEIPVETAGTVNTNASQQKPAATPVF